MAYLGILFMSEGQMEWKIASFVMVQTELSQKVSINCSIYIPPMVMSFG